MNLPETPISRVEQYLSNIARETSPLPEYPLSRVEQYLAYIIENGTVRERLTAEELAALSAIVNEIAASISEEYDPTLTYEAGKLIRHDGKLYRANVDITAPEAWTPEHWTEVDLEDEIAAIKAALADRYTKGETDTLLAGKVDAQQDAEDAGKVLGIGVDGAVVPVNGGDLEIISLTDGTMTLADINNMLADINAAGRHVMFDTSALSAQMYLCTIYIDDNNNPTKYRVNDAVTGKAALGTYVADKTLAEVLAEAVEDFVTIVVTCLTQDGVTVTGQTVTLREGTSHDAPVARTAEYNGQPVSFVVPKDFIYFVEVSDTLAHHFNPTTATGVAMYGTTNVTLTYSDFSNIRTAADIKTALNAGLDLAELVGEQITCAKGSRTLTWDVADYDDTLKEVTLLLHDTLPDQMAFEPSQALAYFENGLAAGDYSFISGSTTYYFTLTKAIPEGGQLKASTSSFTTYESQDSTTALETGTVSSTEVAGATSIGTTASGDLNHMDRVSYGSNNYAESGLRQWLNSTAPANTLMPRINKLSRPYTQNVAGFMADLDPAFLACIADTVWKCATNQTYEAPASLGFGVAKSTPYTVTDKFGLANRKEIFSDSDGTPDGSAQFGLFVDSTADDRKKYYNGSVRSWWLRSPNPGTVNYERYVTTDGSTNSNGASYSNGVVPACKIRKSA